jgi:hypothetical protein
LECVDALVNTPLMKAGFGVHMEMTFGCGEGQNHGIKTNLPAMDDVCLLLHKLRPLILEREVMSFVRTRNLLSERLNDKSVRAVLKHLLQLYDGRVSRSVVRIKVNERLINSEEFLFSWLNAHEYHRDEDRQKEIAELDAAYPEEGSRAIWIAMLIDKCKAILSLAAIIACILGRQQSVESETTRIVAVQDAPPAQSQPAV